MKKILSLLLVFALSFSFITVSANETYFYSDGEFKLSGHVVGFCELTLIDDGSSCDYLSTAIYDLKIDTNSTIYFDTLVDSIFIYDPFSDKGDLNNYEFYNGVGNDDGSCTVIYTPGYREDTLFYDEPEIDDTKLHDNVEYMQENASLRFNRPGIYELTATLGSESCYERISNLVKKYNQDRVFYSQPSVTIRVTVTEETHSEDIYDLKGYDENIVSVSGITNYDESRNVMNDFRVAICSAPVTITAKADLLNMVVSKLEYINGEWVEVRFLDGYGINYGDPNKNWIPGMGFEDRAMYEDCYEYTGDGEFLDGFVNVNKGKSISFTEPGMYSLWAETKTGEFTGLTFEIKDSIASYTDSKVLVNGKEIKFEAYNINDNNYFKLRDIAYVLSTYGEGGRFFNVKWDGERNMISLLTNTKYDAVGGELKEGDGMNKPYELSSSALMKDGINVTLNAYLINGNNYFKLRDLGKLFDFNVSWDGINNCILIDSYSSYIE